MKKNLKAISLMAMIAGVALLASEPAMAMSSNAMTFNGSGQSLGGVANNVTSSLRGVSTLITMCCYLGALVFGLIGAMKWKAYGEQPDRTPFKIPVTYWGIAVCLAGFPEFMGTGITTLWGGGSGSGPQLVNQP